MESIHKFVISRAKISRSSVKVNDLFFTYNGENLQEDLAEVAEVANEKFPDLNDLNGATVTNLVHLFNEDEIKTCYFMCAISLIGKIDNKEFKLDFSSKRGSFLTVKSVAVEPKNDVNEKDASEDPKNTEDPKDVIGDENAPKDSTEEPKDEDVADGEVNDENAPEEPKNEEESGKLEETSEEPKDDKKKVKDDKKKKAAKDASDKL